MSTNSNQQFGNNVAAVMTMRLATLPLMWLVNPAKADRETRKMFSEKEDAFRSVQQQMIMAPTMFWVDLWRGALNGDRDGGLSRASSSAEKRLTQPYRSRVNANKKRLSKGG